MAPFKYALLPLLFSVTALAMNALSPNVKDTEDHKGSILGHNGGPVNAMTLNLQKRATYVNCDTEIGSNSGQVYNITNAIARAQYIVPLTYESMQRNDDANLERYSTWFGSSTTGFYQVSSNFKVMKDAHLESYTYNCKGDCTLRPVKTGYADPNTPGYIYLCPLFFASPKDGEDAQQGTQGGILVYLLSELVVGTKERIVGRDNCLSTAKSLPGLTTDNAASHQFFAEDILNNP